MPQVPSQQSEGRSHAASWLRVHLLTALAIFSLPLERVHGQQTLTWTGGVGGFSVGANWNGGIPPEGFNPVVIDGTLSIGSQASVTTGADFFAGFAPGSAGVVNMNGGFLSPFRTYIGFEGNAAFTLENGSTLKRTRGYVGFLPGSQGLVNLSNSTWTAENLGVPRDITVGVDGAGEIQSASSQISALNFVMGSSVGSTGVVNLRGGTLAVEENLQVGCRDGNPLGDEFRSRIERRRTQKTPPACFQRAA